VGKVGDVKACQRKGYGETVTHRVEIQCVGVVWKSKGNMCKVLGKNGGGLIKDSLGVK